MKTFLRSLRNPIFVNFIFLDKRIFFGKNMLPFTRVIICLIIILQATKVRLSRSLILIAIEVISRWLKYTPELPLVNMITRMFSAKYKQLILH